MLCTPGRSNLPALPGLAGNRSRHLLAHRLSTNPNFALIWNYELSAQIQAPLGFNGKEELAQHISHSFFGNETPAVQVRLLYPPWLLHPGLRIQQGTRKGVIRLCVTEMRRQRGGQTLSFMRYRLGASHLPSRTLLAARGFGSSVKPHRPGQTIPGDCFYSLDSCQTFLVFLIITLTFLVQNYTLCSPALRTARQSGSDCKHQHQNRAGSRVHPAPASLGSATQSLMFSTTGEVWRGNSADAGSDSWHCSACSFASSHSAGIWLACMHGMNLHGLVVFPGISACI